MAQTGFSRLSPSRQKPEQAFLIPSSLLFRDFRLPPRCSDICALLGYYAASNGLKFLTFEDLTFILSRNVGKKLPLYAA